MSDGVRRLTLFANTFREANHWLAWVYIWKVHEQHHTETNDLAVLTMQLTRYLLTIVYNSWWQLTSRSRLEPLHIVSQGKVPLPSGHISSSSSISGLDICMVGWTEAHELTIHVVYCVLALTQTLTQHTNNCQTNNKVDALANLIIIKGIRDANVYNFMACM